MYAIYEEAGKYASGKILSTTDTSAQIELDSGKRIKVKSAQLLLQFEAPAPALLWTQAQEARATMETELAYEFAQDDEFDFIQLAKDYFSSDASLAQKLASLLLLFEAPHYFRRLGKGRFKKAAPEVVALALAAIEKKRLLQAQTDQWAQDLAAGLCPDPIRAQLYKILFKPDKNAAEYKAVVQASHAAQKPPLVLLQAARAIGSAYEFHWQRFLFDQFPKGVQFSPSVLGFTPSAASLESLPLATAPQGPGGEDREVHAFSIDDSMTTEIDDALSVSGLGSGVVTLGIHIAAPALGFKPGDVMDQNARDRLSTVYMPGQKITMLPKTTVDAFTLKAGQRCASVSLYVTLSEESLETLKTFTRVEQVFIAANLRYDRLEKWINTAWLEASEPPDSPEVELNPPHELLPIEHAHAKLSFLYRLALKLKAAREVVRGKPERFNQPDYQFKLEGGTSSDDANAALSDPDTPRGDERVSITPRMRGSGLDLIVAESMILANSTWGGWLSELLTLNGTSSITLAGGFSVGVVPLIHYTGAIAGSGSFNSTIIAPRGVTAVVSNSVSTSTIYAVITSTGGGIVWTGTSPINPNLWDITTSTNWTILGAPTAYLQPVTPGDAVTFNDSGSSSVTLNTTVSPANVTISNAFSSYTFSGSGHIAGTTSLLKQGAGSVALNLAASTYTGNTTVSAGTLKMGAANMIPGGAGNGNVTNNGTIDLNTFSDTMNNLSGSGIIDTVAGGTPTLTVNNFNTNNTVFSGSIKNTAGTLALVKTGTNTLTLSGANTFSGNLFANAGTIIITNGGSANNIGTWVSIGQTTNDNATLTLNGTGSLATTFDFNIGDIGNAIGVLNVKDSASLTMANFFVASANNTGSTASGTVNQTGGTVTQTSSTVGSFAIGGRASASGSGIYNLSGGTLTAAAGIRVGGTGTGTFNQNGGQVNAMGGVNISRLAGSTGTYYLNAGTLTTVNVTSSTGISANLYLNGGLLQATNPANPFMSNLTAATVMVGGAKIDSGTNSIVISQSLLDGGTGGGLTKYGTGTLYLDGANTFTGTTMVTNGTLAGIGSVAGSVVVAPAGKIGAGDAGATVGSLTVSGNLTLQGGATLRINKTGGTPVNDQVVVSGNTTYGGTLTVTNITSDATVLAAGDTFQLLSIGGSTSGAYAVTNLPTLPSGLGWSNSINGSITVVATVNTTPTNITTSVSGNVLTMTWPADHTGWRLIVQTNNLAAGISSNPTDWMTVAGSQSVNTTNITMDPALPTEFYQLVYP